MALSSCVCPRCRLGPLFPSSLVSLLCRYFVVVTAAASAAIVVAVAVVVAAAVVVVVGTYGGWC